VRTLSISLFEKKYIYQVLTEREYKNQIDSSYIQLKLFESQPDTTDSTYFAIKNTSSISPSIKSNTKVLEIT